MAKIGDYIVFKYAYGYDVRGPIGRLTNASVFVPKDYGSKEKRVSFDDIVFVGSADGAKKLDERLTSSRAKLSDDLKNAHSRHRDRDELLIKQAKTAEPTGVAASQNGRPESDAQSLETREVQS